MSRVAHVGRSRGLGFAGGRGGPAAYDIRVIGVLPPRDAGAIRLHGLGAAGLSADERRAGAKGFFNFQGKSDLAMSTICNWPTCYSIIDICAECTVQVVRSVFFCYCLVSRCEIYLNMDRPCWYITYSPIP